MWGSLFKSSNQVIIEIITKYNVGVVYLSPLDYSNISIKQDIGHITELLYSKYVNNHNIFLCGDFNGPTSSLPDFWTYYCYNVCLTEMGESSNNPIFFSFLSFPLVFFMEIRG